MYKKYLITKSADLLKTYKIYKNKLTSIIRSSEKNYFSNKLLKVKDNLAKTWKVLNNMTNRSQKPKIIDQIEKNNMKINDPRDIAEEFNQFFVNVGPELAKQIPHTLNSPKEFLRDNYCKSMFFIPSTAEEISDIISNLKNSTSSGYDNIPIKIIKECKLELSPILSHINNYSMLEGIFPDSLKIAKVVPIYKNGNALAVSNYRPISVLTSCSKITEKIIYNRLEKYIINNSILHKNQFGFRSKMSTCMALLELLDKLSQSIDEKKLTVGIFIDLAKAFDTVNHRILLEKLQHYGIRGVPLQWFQSYLSNRQQYVIIDTNKSQFATIKCGVPQGSILGPILFLLYINDLNSVSKLLRTIMFADDTNLFLTGKSLVLLEKQLNEELIIINEWFKANLLSLNLTKTSYIIFANKKCQDINILINNVSISRQYDTKFLGIILTYNLNWSKHIDIVVNKISKCLGIISKVRHLLPLHITRILYLTLIEPYINYCNLVWCLPVKTGHLDKIFRIQKKYCRLMTFSSFCAPSGPLFQQLRLSTIWNIYKLQLATYMYRIKNNLMPILDHHLFISGSSIHDHNTRHKNDLRKPFCRTTMRQNTICFQGPKLWNDLPDDIKSAPSLNIFKKKLKSFLIIM
jgi:hypothetical protein